MKLPGIAVYAGSDAKMENTGSNGAQDGVGGGGAMPPKAPASSGKENATASSKSEPTPAPSASKTTSEEEENGRMTIFLASEGEGPTVTTPPIIETDPPTVEPAVTDTLESAAGPATVTVTVYAPAPTIGTGDLDVAETSNGKQRGQGMTGASRFHASHNKEGKEAPANAEEEEGIELVGEDVEAIQGGGQSGVPIQGEEPSRQQGEAPAGDIPDECLLELHRDTGVYERDLRRSRMRRRSGSYTILRR